MTSNLVMRHNMDHHGSIVMVRVCKCGKSSRSSMPKFTSEGRISAASATIIWVLGFNCAWVLVRLSNRQKRVA